MFEPALTCFDLGEHRSELLTNDGLVDERLAYVSFVSEDSRRGARGAHRKPFAGEPT